MDGPPHDDSGRDAPSRHELIEHYTPDGTIGRVLLGVGLSVGGGFTALIGLAGVLQLDLLAFLAGLVGIGLGLSALVVGLVTLWPVYLAAIGNVDSPAAYGVGLDRTHRDGDPVTILERRYAAGELSREEFERRLDDVLGDPTTHRRRGDDDRATRPTTSGSRRSEPESEDGYRDVDSVGTGASPDEEQLRSTRERARRRRETGDERGS
ncbi:SHOCT domain-containing protein [Halobaculum sp. MBLA0147]|uniref:SHOCT domain-containing protein n=1 Tax=Halobaculum sp. MBLA0147 TaxID=3079934 RepID=UPI0035251C92